MPKAAKPGFVNCTLRFTTEMHAEMYQTAKDRDVSVNLLVVKAVRQFLDALVPVDEIVRTKSGYEGTATVADKRDSTHYVIDRDAGTCKPMFPHRPNDG